MKQTLNKILLTILLIVLAFTAFSCSNTNNNTGDQGGDNSEQEQEQILLEQEIQDAKEAFSALCLVNTYCNDMSSAITSAWYYAIYHAEDEKSSMFNSGSRDNWDEFIVTWFWFLTSGMGSQSIIRQAMQNYIGGTDGAVWATALTNFSYAVGVAKEYNNLSGGLSEAKKYLDEAYATINKLTEKNKQSTYKEDLAELYATLNTYYKSIESPSGSYNSYTSAIRNHKTDISTKTSKIEIYLG